MIKMGKVVKWPDGFKTVKFWSIKIIRFREICDEGNRAKYLIKINDFFWLKVGCDIVKEDLKSGENLTSEM